MRTAPERPCSGCAGRAFSIVKRASFELGSLDMSVDFTLFICNACGRTDWFLREPELGHVTKLAEQATVRDDSPYR